MSSKVNLIATGRELVMGSKEMHVEESLVEDEELKEFDDNEEDLVVQDMEDIQNEDVPNGVSARGIPEKLLDIPEFTRKDKTLNEILDMMEENPPIIPDAVIDFYLTRNGFDCSDVRVKRLLALATQKFVSDIAGDAYEYSRIRSAITVHNSNNGQARARQLILGQQQPGQLTQQQQQQNEKTKANKVVLTVNDLSSAVSEYGLNVTRPDFYR